MRSLSSKNDPAPPNRAINMATKASFHMPMGSMSLILSTAVALKWAAWPTCSKHRQSRTCWRCEIFRHAERHRWWHCGSQKATTESQSLCGSNKKYTIYLVEKLLAAIESPGLPPA